FLVESASPTGSAVVAAVCPEPAAAGEIDDARARIAGCAASMQRRLDTSDLPDLLYEEAESSRWDEVARRCLSCTNCTMVCPTCFCHAVVDQTELDGNMS